MTVLALIAAATLAATSPSIPSTGAPASPSARVAFGDLDLASSSGAQVLDARIARAAARTCRSIGGRSIAGRTDCQAAFHQEALTRLPVAAREDYARSRARRLDL